MQLAKLPANPAGPAASWSSSQLVGLRRFDPNLSGTQQAVNLLVFGSFHVWVELLPPTEAFPKGDDCQPPLDDPRTPFNESSFFNW